MTSRFVSGGTIAGDEDAAGGGEREREWEWEWERERADKKNPLSAEWETVQKDLDEERRRREETRRANVEGGGAERSLYEVLQANKAAKQAAFEEQNRIRNQFRALDDDEIDFLHGVNDERRAEEDRVRRETEEGLAGFREKQQRAAIVDGGDGDGDTAGGVEHVDNEWGNPAAGRKRKREKEKEKGVLKGVKRRTSAGAKDGKAGDDTLPGNTRVKSTSTESATPKEAAVGVPANKPKPALGLVDYGSDDDDD
ncbi:N-terminal domain of NEFA-interacting nuclear protein NIP30-domain-containing protein [Xylaria telfairii]|nr:N-terminal domain of NEFA-interacting nuclear protein NIP30-domain-containing protein [Xylaria telfairii]